MALNDDLNEQCRSIFATGWKEREGTVIPSETSLTFANDGINIEGAVLYADLTGSTKLVDGHSRHFAAEVYKTFLHCAAKIIRSEGGEITAYDGDRIMAVFIGYMRTNAVRAALKINYAVKFIIQPRLKAFYTGSSYVIQHCCGVDYSGMMVAKTGIRGANDLVWAGRAPNYAAKLTELGECATWITPDVHDIMLDEVKFGGTPRRAMWTPRIWPQMNNGRIYSSNFWWNIK